MATTPSKSIPLDGDHSACTELRCLSVEEGQRMCEELTRWMATQPRSCPSDFTSVCDLHAELHADRYRKPSVSSFSPTFTSVFDPQLLTPEALTPAAQSLTSLRRATVHAQETDQQEPFTAMEFIVSIQDDLLVEDFI